MTRRSDAIFYRMRRMPVLCVVALSAILLVGCGGGSQAGQEHSRHSAKLDLHSQGDSGVSGVVSFEDIPGGVIVKLSLHDLPKPDAFYLAHIHPGTCAQGDQEEDHDHGEHGGTSAEEIEWPLSQIKSDTHGNGSSTTTLKDTSVEQLFSGQPKHVNVHAVGSGNPPVMACANLNSQAIAPVKAVKEPTTPQTAPPTPRPATSADAGVSSKEQAAQSEADCRLVIYVVQENMSRQKANEFSELLANMIGTMKNLYSTEGYLRNAALDHLGVPRYPECKVGGE